MTSGKPYSPAPAGALRTRARLRPALPDLLALGFLLALALLLLGRQILLGGSFYNDDILLQSLPAYTWLSEGLREGRIPIWSPALLGGFPLALGQYGFFYPPDLLLFRLLEVTRAFHLSLALHLALAGGCAYWYCRVLGMRRLPALLAAVLFQMGNEALAWPVNGFLTRTLFALPALLAAVELTYTRGPRYWLLAPPIVGGALLAGYAQFVLFSLVVAGVYALVLALGVPRSRTQPRRHEDTKAHRESAFVSSCLRGLDTRAWRRHQLVALVLLGAGVALGLGLAAVRVAPTLALAGLSTRAAGMGLERSAVDSIEPWALAVGYLLPAALEMPGRLSARPDYLTAPALLLAALALGAGRRLGRIGLFHAGLVAVATLLSLGKSTPLYALLLQLPFFSYFRAPNRFSLVAALGIAVLAAWALDRGLALDLPRRRWRYRAVVALGAGATAIAIAALALSLSFQFGGDPFSKALRSAAPGGGWDTLNALRLRVAVPLLGLAAAPLLVVAAARRRISHRALELSALGLSAATLFLLGWIQNPWLPPAALSEPPALLSTLREDPGPFRVYSWDPRFSTYNVGAYYTGRVGRPPSREFEERYLRQFLPPNLGMLFGVATADGYEALQTRRQALVGNYVGSERDEYARFSDGDGVEWGLRSLSLHARLNLLAALNVRYLLHAFPVEDPRLERLGEVALQIYPELPAVAGVHLHRLKNAMPRALVVPEAVVMASERDVLETLLAGSVELRRAAILEEVPPSLEAVPLSAAGSGVEILEYHDERVVVRARTDGSGFLVLMDFLLPGWTASVDGRPEPILAANFAGRAVPIRGAGEHLIEFSYEAPLLRQGLAVSLASLGLLLSIGLARRLRARD